jgi:hypothetical protein
MITMKSIFTLLLAGIVCSFLFIACESDKQSVDAESPPNSSPYQFESTGEDYLISALDEFDAIADMKNITTRANRTSNLSSQSQKQSLPKPNIDTVIVYGSITPDGYGATITERYTHPKGLPLITVRKSYGKENGHVVTATKRYVSIEDYLNNNPQQSNITEIYGLSRDTIVTYVLRNGTLETYTFRLPVVTRTINPQDGSIKVSSRYGLDNMVVTEVKDGTTNIVSQLRKTYGLADGSLITRTEYADSSWRQVRTLGRSDGSILREITSSK